jgi:hypothetical protein
MTANALWRYVHVIDIDKAHSLVEAYFLRVFLLHGADNAPLTADTCFRSLLLRI